MYFIHYFRHNPDLTVAMLFAIIVSSLVPFSSAAILASINVPLLGLLFCLMTIVAGLRQSGLFTYAYRLIFNEHTSSRKLGRFFIFSCFFSSMLITNDVSLIIFVPLAIMILTDVRAIRLLIPVVTWQTIAANMGSMLTPIGNPQNLFIYSYYNLSLRDFLSITFPIHCTYQRYRHLPCYVSAARQGSYFTAQRTRQIKMGSCCSPACLVYSLPDERTANFAVFLAHARCHPCCHPVKSPPVSGSRL